MDIKKLVQNYELKYLLKMLKVLRQKPTLKRINNLIELDES